MQQVHFNIRYMGPNNSGGAIKGYNCYLRYKLGALNITVPHVTELPPSTQSNATRVAHARYRRLVSPKDFADGLGPRWIRSIHRALDSDLVRYVAFFSPVNRSLGRD
jgi:hypothetical protein